LSFTEHIHICPFVDVTEDERHLATVKVLLKLRGWIAAPNHQDNNLVVQVNSAKRAEDRITSQRKVT